MKQHLFQLQAAVVMEQEESSNSDKDEPWKNSAGGLTAPGHIGLLSLSWVRGGRRARRRRRHARRRWNHRRHGCSRGNMAFARCHCRCEADETNHDENNRVGIAEVEVTAAHFRQQEKHADGNDHHGAHEAADGATLAGASDAIAHLYLTSRRSLLRLAVHAVPKHQDPDADENEGPEPSHAVPLKPFKIVEQEQDSNANQYDWTNRPLPAEIIQRV